jgi:Cys-rich repeat protein
MSREMRLFFEMFILLCLSVNALSGCGDNNGPYEGGNYPGGIVGAWCRANVDCSSGYCCTSPACGHGMCSYACRADIDCPAGARCEAGTCFLACAADYDCFEGQHCAHERTVCQY